MTADTRPVVELDAAEAEAVVRLVGGMIRERAVVGRPVPYGVQQLYRRLCSAVQLSPTRQAKQLGMKELETYAIGSREAAQLLGWSQRRVQRRWRDLDGRRVGGRLIFDQRTVREYAKGLAQQGDRH